MGTVRVYLDLPLFGGILGCIQDATLLWMVGQIAAYRPSWLRFLMGGAVGGLFQFLLLVNQESTGIIHPWILSPILSMLLVPCLMLGISFCPINFLKGLRLFGYFYLISFLLSGIHWGLDTLNQRFWQREISLSWRFGLHLTLIFILGELGWGIIHRKVWEKTCLYPVQVCWDNCRVNFTALVDTGNILRDPLTKAPVIIVESKVLQSYLPPELLMAIGSIENGDLDFGWNLPEKWSERFRILPFHSLGNTGGLLIGFRPDEIIVWQNNKACVHKNLVVGFYQQKLSSEGIYQGLIPPAVLGA